jgi:hypothetical protein
MLFNRSDGEQFRSVVSLFCYKSVGCESDRFTRTKSGRTVNWNFMGRLKLLGILMGLVGVGIVPLHANGILFQFDELGDLSCTVTGEICPVSSNSGVEADFTTGPSGNVLVFDLTSELAGQMFSNGDVEVLSHGGGVIGDLRFTTSGGTLAGNETCTVGSVSCLMIFYSFDNDGFAADVGNVNTSFLRPLQAGVTVSPTGAFMYSTAFVSYHGILLPTPVPAPEPATTAPMFLLGLGAFAFLWRSKGRRHNETTGKSCPTVGVPTDCSFRS